VRLLVPIRPADAPRLRAALDAIQPGNTTNLSGGWLKGAEQLRSTHGTRKILLLTHSLANEGITDPAALVRLATGARGEGIGTTTIGFGDGFNEDLLTAMADAGGGNAHYAASADAAPAIFAEEFDELSRLWQNLSLEIRPTNAVEVLGVLNEYPSVEVSGGLQVELGDAYEGERRGRLEASCPRAPGAGRRQVADLILRYVSVGDPIEQHELTIPVAVKLVADALELEQRAVAPAPICRGSGYSQAAPLRLSPPQAAEADELGDSI
jgi:Ca-activated chloride channel family protein